MIVSTKVFINDIENRESVYETIIEHASTVRKSIGVGWKAQKLSVKEKCEGQVCDYVVMFEVVLVLLRNKNLGIFDFWIFIKLRKSKNKAAD